MTQLFKSTTLTKLLPQVIPYLKLLVLFGSRARGDNHPNSDWDFAILYDEELHEQTVKGFSRLELYSILADILEVSTDKIDIVEINNCSTLVAHYIARDGKLLYEKETGLFDDFSQKALMTKTELQTLRQNWRQEIEQFLEKQGV
ncbi:MAG: nucleotidyltransferase domain-containing protein [Oscillatoria sp. PMC 1068.18]|nr:nucleotidyltransferase domain-containing protein [Oscillatoria sp. PMC 1076.18]MEC4987330.1 nucleotidyltransferase domain-containing protein [Oscillatoria sp. PMC 1068.18]